MTSQLVAFDNPCLCWRNECSCLSGLFYKLYYSFPLLCLLSLKYYSTHTKNVYEQATVYGVSVFSEMILWTKETFSFNSNALHLESNLIHSFPCRCKVWKLGNITWGIFNWKPDLTQFVYNISENMLEIVLMLNQKFVKLFYIFYFLNGFCLDFFRPFFMDPVNVPKRQHETCLW